MSSFEHHDSIADEPTGSNGSQESAPRQDGGLRWVTLFLVALIAIPILTHWIPAEIALWKQANARNHWEADDREAALTLNAQALKWDEDNQAILTERADWLAELNRFDEAIGIYESLLQNVTTAGQTPYSIQLRMQLSNHYNSRSLHNEVITEETWEQWKIIDRWYQTNDRERELSLIEQANLYNSRAYQLAISNTHLDEALESATYCLDLLGGEIYCLYNDPLFYVQLAYQAYRQQNYRTAMESLNRAVDKLSRHHTLLKATSPSITWKAFEKKQLQRRLTEFEIIYANVLLFRSSCRQHIELEGSGPAVISDAEELTDQQRAAELGITPEQFNVEMFSGDSLLSLNSHMLIPMALDTRGFLYYLTGNPQLALIDLEVAVQSTEYELNQFAEVLEHEKHRLADKDLAERQRLDRVRNLAVILYHRSLVYDATHQVAKAKRDRERITELGFSAGPLLH